MKTEDLDLDPNYTRAQSSIRSGRQQQHGNAREGAASNAWPMVTGHDDVSIVLTNTKTLYTNAILYHG